MEQELTAAVPVPGVANHKGPNLFGIFGRKVASESSYNNYSAQALYKDTIWDENNLEKFLTNPKGFIPGTSMVFDGLKNEADRKGMHEYIQWQHVHGLYIGTLVYMYIIHRHLLMQ